MPFSIKNDIFPQTNESSDCQNQTFRRKSAKAESFGVYLERKILFAILSHAQTRTRKRTFLLVVNGSYTETYGNRSLLCSPSNFLFHAGDFPHAEHYHKNGGYAFIVEIEKDWLKHIRDQVNFPKYSVDFKNGKLPQLGAKLYQEFRRFDSLSPLIIEGVMLEIAGETARQTFEKKNASPPWLKRVEMLLKERFNENLSLTEIAEFVQIHPVHLAQSFRKYRNTTVGNYLREIRLENAKKDLIETKKSLSEIALNNGFSDQSHFSRLFKQKFGITPNQFRQSI